MYNDRSTGNIIHHGLLSDYEKGLVWNRTDDNELSQLLIEQEVRPSLIPDTVFSLSALDLFQVRVHRTISNRIRTG